MVPIRDNPFPVGARQIQFEPGQQDEEEDGQPDVAQRLWPPQPQVKRRVTRAEQAQDIGRKLD